MSLLIYYSNLSAKKWANALEMQKSITFDKTKKKQKIITTYTQQIHLCESLSLLNFEQQKQSNDI